MNMKRTGWMLGLLLLASTVGAQTPAFKGKAENCKSVPANTTLVTYTGRTEVLPDGAVRFDWVGTYFQTDFSGGRIDMLAADKGTSYYNIFVDGKLKAKIKVTGKEKQLVKLASVADKRVHRLKVQKCTEGEFGCTTISAFLLAPKGTMKAVPRQHRTIEIYGDSYTCGYGDESAAATDPFKLETENCDKAYGCIIARYFNADYVLIAHSGRGVVHNWGDTLQLSRSTMSTRMAHVYDDFDAKTVYHFNAYQPDIVMINLGTNDFSVNALPTDEQFVGGYVNMLKQIRSSYGNVPILCIIAHSANDRLTGCMAKVKELMKADKNLYIGNPMNDIITEKYDMGASYHPNYQGQRKVAMTLIPRISAIMGWGLEDKVVK
jgi:lysophospholipase L1-like esterase